MSNEEIWKDIEGYEGYYQVSNMGRVRSVDRVVENNKGGYCQLKGRLLKFHTTKKGYHRVNLNKNGKIKYFLVHRLVTQAFISNPESKPQVNHIDGVKTNNNVSNLEWCTPSENIKHSFESGLNNNKGERHHKSKLNRDDVITIKLLYSKGKHTLKDIGNMFNVHNSTISEIINGVSWKHI